MSILVLVAFSLSVLIITLYSLTLIDLIRINLVKKKIYPFHTTFAQLPKITVQLPIFNEMNVVEELIDVVMKLDYPKELLEVQILDDSTDETLKIAQHKATEYQKNGYDIYVIHRKNRDGFKGGALRNATSQVKGEFMAIFDADFKPKPDFLKKVLFHFDNEKVSCVQTKWGHINAWRNWFTVSQVLALDVFYVEEQEARSKKNYYLRFNGSGGVWRKTAVEDAGGWSGDTLSEDLDLAYRAQMKGWEFRYDRSIECPAELPENLSDLKKQQYRWTYGKVQVIKKLLKTFWHTKMRFDKKVHGLADLFNIAAAMSIIFMALMSVPANYSMRNEEYRIAWTILSIGSIYTPVILYMTFSAFNFHLKNKGKTLFYLIKYLIPFFILFTGITWHQCLAIVDQLRGKKIVFQRTPKFKSLNNSIKKNYQNKKSVSYVNVVEIIGMCYFLYGIYLDLTLGVYAFLPFHITLTLALGGFALTDLIEVFSVSQLKKKSSP